MWFQGVIRSSTPVSMLTCIILSQRLIYGNEVKLPGSVTDVIFNKQIIICGPLHSLIKIYVSVVLLPDFMPSYCGGNYLT